MSDNESGPKREEANLYLKLPKEKLVEFDVKVAKRQIKRPQALAEAVLLWIKNSDQEIVKSVDFDKNPSYYSERASKAIQKSSDAIKLIQESIAELQRAPGETKIDVVPEPADLDKLIDDAAKKAEDVLREADSLKKELQENQGLRRKRK